MTSFLYSWFAFKKQRFCNSLIQIFYSYNQTEHVHRNKQNFKKPKKKMDSENHVYENFFTL